MSAAALPDKIYDEAQLDEVLTRPTPAAVQAMAELGGDLLILGAGGKMGPTLAVLARRAADAAGLRMRVLAASRFSNSVAALHLEQAGVETLRCDLLVPGALDTLPDVPNVAFLVGTKFGSTGQEPRTWAVNACLPGLVAHRYRAARIVALSTGNVYPFVSPQSGGATEETPPGPVGEYAMSCLGRERLFEYGALEYGTQVLLFRLNYATDLRYGVLLDLAQQILAGQAIDLTMGYVNVIWQGDANERILRGFALADAPAAVLNVTGAETLSVRALALSLGRLLGREPVFTGNEGPVALLSSARRSITRFGLPQVPLETMLRWTAHWIAAGGRTLGKPTKFQVRDGRF